MQNAQCTIAVAAEAAIVLHWMLVVGCWVLVVNDPWSLQGQREKVRGQRECCRKTNFQSTKHYKNRQRRFIAKEVKKILLEINTILSFLGSALGCIAGILTSQKLTNYRLEQLEKKVNKHNNLVERMTISEMKIENLERSMMG